MSTTNSPLDAAATPVPTVTLFFQPMLTVALTGTSGPAPQTVAMLFIDAPKPAAAGPSGTSFETFAGAALQSVLQSSLFSPVSSVYTRNSLCAFLEKLSMPQNRLTFDDVVSIILNSANFSLAIRQLPATPAASTAATYSPFPMLPFLKLSSRFDHVSAVGETLADIGASFGIDMPTLEAANPGITTAEPPSEGTTVHIPAGTTVDFASRNPCTAAYVQSVATYFGADDAGAASSGSDPSMAALLLTDYCQAVVSELLRDAIDAFALPSNNNRPFTYKTIVQGDTLAKISSRFQVDLSLLQSVNATLPAPAQQLSVGTSVQIPDSPSMPVTGSGSAMALLTSSYASVASSAAAFLLHGLRLPAPPVPPATPAQDGPSVVLTPLYVLTGQQLALPEGNFSNYTLHLDPSPAQMTQAAPSIELGARSKLSVVLSSQYLAAISGATSFNPLARLLHKTQLPPYGTLPTPFPPRPFPLGPPTRWNTTSLSIFNLPANLRTLVATSPNGAVYLDVMAGTAPMALTPPPAASPAPVMSSVWYTQVDFNIRRIADPSHPGRFLTSTYAIEGTDFEGRNDLQALIQSNLTPTVNLLYPNDASSPKAGLVSDTKFTAILLKSNLSTGAHEPLADTSSGASATQGQHTFSATISSNASTSSDPSTFLKFLWECSVVPTGGFILIYQDGSGNDPLASRFTLEPTIRLTLMAQVPPDSNASAGFSSGNVTRSFHNCVAFPPPANRILFIQASAYSVAPGDTLQQLAPQLKTTVENLGAANAMTPNLLQSGSDNLLSVALKQNTTVNAVADASAASLLTAQIPIQVGAQWVLRRAALNPENIGFRVTMKAPASPLEQLYSMLGYRVVADSNFNQNKDGVPVAPSAPSAGNGTRTMQTFDRVVSVASLAINGKPGTATITTPDPYGGLGQSVSVAIQPQDIFGNRCLNDSSALNLAIPILYRDPLIGPGQWPQARCSYRFGLDAATQASQLIIQLDLDPIPTTATADQIQAQLSLYSQIYFQLMQSDVTVSATTSLGSVADSTALQTELVKFVTDAHACLSGAGGRPTATIGLALTPHFPDLVFDVTASVTISRTANFDPFFTDFDYVQTVTTDLKAQALATTTASTSGTTSGGQDAGLLRAFATEFQAVFPALKLALGGDPSSIDPQSKSRVLVAVQLNGAGLNFSAIDNPRFFAVKPLSTIPWSSSDTVPIQTYTTGKLSTLPLQKNFRGIDLDGWGRDFLSTLDLFLAPQTASAAQQVSFTFPAADPTHFASTRTGTPVATDAFSLAAGAKATLARALRDAVAELTPADPSGTVPQEVAGVMYESLLVTLSDAYSVDAIVHFPVKVTNKGADPTLRLNVQPAGNIFKIPASATLTTVGAFFSPAPLSQVLDTIADVTGILRPGATVTLGTASHSVTEGDTIRSLATSLGLGAPHALVTTPVVTQTGLLNSGVSLGVFVKSYTSTADDDLRSVIDYLAPPLTDRPGLLAAVANFTALNLNTPGLFTPGTQPAMGAASHTTLPTDTLSAIATALNLAPEEFVIRALDLAGLIQSGQVFTFLALAPAFTLSAAQIDKKHASVTTLFHTATGSPTRNMTLDLSYGITGLERNVKSLAFAPQYETSEWLTFLLPIDPLPVGKADIPIPLRAYPLPPSLISQTLDQNELPANPQLGDLVNYEYSYQYSYTRAAQDQLFARVSATVDNPVVMEQGNLPLSLAQYYDIATDLKRDLAAGNPDALQTFACLADTISNDWATWVKQGPPPLPTAGSVVEVIESVNLDGTRSSALKATGTQVLPAGANVNVASDVYTHNVPEQNVIDAQSITGSVFVTRNASLLTGLNTNPAFVYHVPDVRFPTAAVPLLRYTKRVDAMLAPDWPKATPMTLESSLQELFTLVLKPPQVLSKAPRFVRLAVSYEFSLAGNEPPDGTAPGVRLPNIETLTPVLMRPTFGFDVTADLLPGGFCTQLASFLKGWQQNHLTQPAGGHWVLDLSFYASDTSDAGAPPLLEITTLRLPVALV